ncbi:MAG: NUDIX hydrolase [Hyphomicrobiaceae bacterium]|nr:NUDIX hydrolase [Hyphomicrobiaceae bacterium]
MTKKNKNFIITRPDEDSHDREVCNSCGYINYKNPKIIVGSVVFYADHIMMCRRSIEPSRGLWTLPAGYLELGETLAEGAQREAQEEACATITINSLLALYSLAHLSQVQIIYLATLLEDNYAPGPESIEVKLFSCDMLPWQKLAFPSVSWALKHALIAKKQGLTVPFTSAPDLPLK